MAFEVLKKEPVTKRFLEIGDIVEYSPLDNRDLFYMLLRKATAEDEKHKDFEDIPLDNLWLVATLNPNHTDKRDWVLPESYIVLSKSTISLSND